jgi:hypothetical protein
MSCRNEAKQGREKSAAAYTGGSTVSRACFIPQRKHRNRRAKPLSSTCPASVTASAASNVRDEPQWQHSTFSPQPNRTRSAVVRTCFVDIATAYPQRNDS